MNTYKKQQHQNHQTINVEPDSTNPMTLVETQSNATAPHTTAMDAIQKKHRQKTQVGGFMTQQSTGQSMEKRRQNSNTSMPVGSPEQIYSQIQLKSEVRQSSKSREPARSMPQTTLSANSAQKISRAQQQIESMTTQSAKPTQSSLVAGQQ